MVEVVYKNSVIVLRIVVESKIVDEVKYVCEVWICESKKYYLS